MATPIWQWSAVDTAAAIRDGRATSEEVVQAHIDRMRAANPAINAIVVDLSAQAIAAARTADRALAQGATPGKLQGVPVTIEINIDVVDALSHCQRATICLGQRRPAPVTSRRSRNLGRSCT